MELGVMQSEGLLSQAQADKIARFGVGAIIARSSDVLLVRRRSSDFMGGTYEFPGGGVETGESLQDTLTREVEEETGLRISKVKGFVGSFDYESETSERARCFCYLVSVSGSEAVRLSEHDNHAWVSRENVGRFSVTEEILGILKALWSR